MFIFSTWTNKRVLHRKEILQLRYNKTALLLSSVTLGLFIGHLGPLHVNAATEGNLDNSDLVITKGTSEDISKENGTTYHIVRNDETVYSISEKYGISQEALKVWNNISNNVIHVGQILSVNGVNVYEELVKENNQFSSTQQFINSVAPIALEVAGKYDLYPSVMIAQATLETGSGTSELAVLANNYFGIKGTYKGKSIYKISPEEVNGDMVSHSSRFRIYPSLYASFVDNGKRLRKGPNGDSEEVPWNVGNYKETWVENAFTYRDATQGLVNGGYATDSNYATKLNNIIENYNLIEYDKQLYNFVEEREQYIAEEYARTFVAEVQALPNVSTIQAMTKAELTKFENELSAVRSMYSQLIASDKELPRVKTWENYLQQKENATQASLNQEPEVENPSEVPEESEESEGSDSQAFIIAAKALPLVSEIEAMSSEQLYGVQAEMDAARGLYNALPASEQANANVDRWEGYLADKEVMTRELQVTGEEFIAAVDALPSVSAIEAMNDEQLSVLEGKMDAARDLYDPLPASEKDKAGVARWEGYLSDKESAAHTRSDETDVVNPTAAKEFIVAARELPSVSEIEEMLAPQLRNTQSNLAAVRAQFNALTPATQQEADVSRWEGYLRVKEEIADTLLESGEGFILAAKALPSIGEINGMDENQLAVLDDEMPTVRALYDALTSASKNKPEISRWEGYLAEKESAVYSRLNQDKVFVKTARELPNISEIEEMDNKALKALEEEVLNVRTFYESLSTANQEIDEVAKWEDYLTEKEDVISTQLIITENEEAIAAFLDAAKALPTISEMNQLSNGRLENIERDFAEVRSLYDGLTTFQQSNGEVTIWEGYLTAKEVAVENIYTAADQFIKKARSLPSVAEINRMNEQQMERASAQLNTVRETYNDLASIAYNLSHVQTWESYLTEKENAIFSASSVRITKTFEYGIESGDTLNSIAEKFQVDLDALIARNSHLNPTNLKAGDIVYIQNAIARPMDHSQARDGQHTVYLDAGHGGWQTGANAFGTSEKDMNLVLARKLTNRLEAMGYTVINVRTSDEQVDLTDRARKANGSNADIFISLHHNALNGSVQGIETFYYKNARTINPTINQTYHNDGARLANSVYLSHLIQDNLVGETGANYRRVAGQSFAVLRETNLPATLIEFGFMDNRQEFNKLTNGSYQNKMVNATADAIDTYFNALYN